MEQIAAIPAIKDIVPLITSKIVISSIAKQLIIASLAKDLVVFRIPLQNVITKGCGYAFNVDKCIGTIACSGTGGKINTDARGIQ